MSASPSDSTSDEKSDKKSDETPAATTDATAAAVEESPETDEPRTGGLYRHKLRPEWGMAVLATETADRREYLFDDGQLRVFKEGFFALFEPVVDEGFTATAIAEELTRAAEATGAARKGPKLQVVYPFETQVEIFKKLYPEGFAGEAWQKGRRGLPDQKRLKRHRDAAVADAQARLAPDVISAMCDEERYSDVIATLVDVLGKTDLASNAAVTRIGKMEQEAVGPVARATRELIAGEADYGTRFTRFVAALYAACNSRPTWRLATALPALVFPEEHVCVQKAAFLKQAASIAPELSYTRDPRRKAYANFQVVALRTRDLLADAGLKPKDLVDVHDFAWLTLRPAAAKLLD